VAPLLARERRFLGPVGFERKRRLLAAASCVLLPSLAPETSSLVAMEALAAGTPVIAYPSGALAEIVEDGRTGFLVRDVDEMAAATRRVGEIDPGTCRAAARERFGVTRMTQAYLDRYRRLAQGAGAIAA
jgi:glycosyltransferase involved in cell wall biosynthesis